MKKYYMFLILAGTCLVLSGCSIGGLGELTDRTSQKKFIDDAKTEFKKVSEIDVLGSNGETKLKGKDFSLEVFGSTTNALQIVSVKSKQYTVKNSSCTASTTATSFDKSKINLMNFNSYYYEGIETVGGIKTYKYYVIASQGGSPSYMWFNPDTKLPVKRDTAGNVERVFYNNVEVTLPSGCK
jgi:hypothetical protein